MRYDDNQDRDRDETDQDRADALAKRLSRGSKSVNAEQDAVTRALTEPSKRKREMEAKRGERTLEDARKAGEKGRKR